MPVTSIRRLLTPYDIALGAAILLAGLLSLYWVGVAGAADSGALRIEVQGRLVSEHTFTAADPPRLISVNAPRGPITVELREGKARVQPLPVAVCPTGVCWNSGWTSHPAKAIVCLPNQMVVRVVRAGRGVDGITR
jgi:hypothetical protein